MNRKKFPKTDAVAVAFSCRPDSGSEWGVGWNYLILLSSMFRAVKIYIRDAESQKTMVKSRLEQLGIFNVTLVFVNDTNVYSLLKSIRMHNRLFQIAYISWIIKVFFLQLNQHDWRKYDVAFHLTWVSDWIPSLFFLLPYRKKILGPIGSQGRNFNKRSSDYLGSLTRYALKWLVRLNPLNWVIAFSVDAVIGINNQTLTRLPWSIAKRPCPILPVHIESKICRSSVVLNKKYLTFVGKNIAFKNIDIFIDITNAYLRSHKDVRVAFYGDMRGDEAFLKARYEKENRDRVEFHGVVDQSTFLKSMSEKHTILFQPTSEAGGTIGVECISLGIPVICGKSFGLDAFFEPGVYKLTVESADLSSPDVVGEVFSSVFDTYKDTSGYCSEQSQNFKISVTREKLAGLIGNVIDG